MSERDDLLASVASEIRTYRKGDLPEPTPEHVDRWLHQFTPAQQLPFLREFEHVIKQTFFTRKKVKDFLRTLVTNAKLAGADPAAYWSSANFLSIQQNGQSQKAMVSLFADALQQKCGLDLSKCGAAGGDYIYLDDVLFTGGRVATDLQAWIAGKAPANAVIHVILMAFYTSGHYYNISNRLKKEIATSGKKIKICSWRLIELKNQKNQKDVSDVLWPAVVPADAAVQAYIEAEKSYPLAMRNAGGALGVFSSEAGRQVLENEFLIAGAKIRAMIESPKQSMRPLGFSPFGVGFGSMIVTYRNCPNNCPLAMWWGDPEATSGALCWYPLLWRKTYAA